MLLLLVFLPLVLRRFLLFDVVVVVVVLFLSWCSMFVSNRHTTKHSVERKKKMLNMMWQMYGKKKQKIMPSRFDPMNFTYRKCLYIHTFYATI